MTKVHMDVMRPWIAKRVTELIGFEDEVLINFIYGLLEGKEVNGKQVQISLTGFMERNTGKFMKELWTLLLSAQNNASGVPQEFLDAKAEETKKKQAETDRIANEIQRKREMEGRELDQERTKKMDAGNIDAGNIDAGMEPSSKYHHRASDTRSAEEKDFGKRNGSRGRIRISKSPHSSDHLSSPRGMRSRSNSKSFSSSRSHSDERRRLRSLSTSPKRRGLSSSAERGDLSPRKHSLSPQRRHSPGHSLTPPRRRSSYSRRSYNRSRSPRYRMRSPLHRGSRSPLSRRSRSPIWCSSRTPVQRSRFRSRSPVRRSRFRSRSPVRHISPSSRHRSPSPIRRRSPSPMYRSRSPVRRRYQRSPLTPRHGSPYPVRRRSPGASRRRSPTPVDHRSPSAQDWSTLRVRHGSPSPVMRKSPRRQKSPVPSAGEISREKTRYHDPLRRTSPGASGPLSADDRERSVERQPRSDSWDRNDSCRKVGLSPSPKRPFVSESERQQNHSEERRVVGKRKSPIKNSNDRHNSKGKSDSVEELSPDERLGGRAESNKKVVSKSGNKLEKMDHVNKPAQPTSQMIGDVVSSERERELPVGEGDRRVVEKNQTHSNDIKITDQGLENVSKLSKKLKKNDESGSASEESDKKIQAEVREKRNKKRSDRQEPDSYDESSYDSYEERKEAKRRREEKKLKKEERRRRKERRQQRREERRTDRNKQKSVGSVSTRSDSEKYHDDYSDDDHRVRRPKPHRRDAEEDESEQKKLEIELREKALKSLRAKKGNGH